MADIKYKVIDVSEHNTITDANWKTIKSKGYVVVLRIGLRGSVKSNTEYYGKIRYDFKFKEYLSACKKYGIPCSVYFFPTSITEEEAHEEGKWLVNALKENKVEPVLPICQDTEMVDGGNGRADKLSKANRTKFINIVNQHLKDAGYKYGVYASTSWYKDKLNDNDLMSGTYRWVAQNPKLTYTAHDVFMWQYGTMTISNKKIDANNCYIDLIKKESSTSTKKASATTTATKTVQVTEAMVINKMIEYAKDEIGYVEKKSNKDLYSKTANAGSNNYTKYGYEMHQLQPSNMDFPAAWCFIKGTMVLTNKGYKDISEIKIGDKVLSADGTHFNTVIRTTNHEANIFEMKYMGGTPLYATGEHPVYSRKRLHVRKDAGFTTPQFNPIKELKKGDGLALTMTKLNNDIELSYDEAWLIGYYVGDGWKSRNTFYICGNDQKCIHIENHGIYLHKEKMYDSRTCQQYVIGNEYSNLYSILNECGCGAWDKQVPVTILYANNANKQAFLDGYFTADGFSSKSSTNIGYTTVSEKLALGINKLATDLGYGAFIRLQARNKSYKYYDARYDRYREIKTNDIYYGSINMAEKNSCEIIDGYSYHTIKAVTNLDKTDTVYNIETDGDHTYVANNIAVHNCDSYVDWIILQTCKFYGYGAKEAKQVLCGDFDDYTVRSADYYKKKGRWFTKPQKGDQIFFKNNSGICHTGIVTEVTSTKVFTIEGNTSTASGVVANGGGVASKSYSISYNRIAGYGRPDWSSILGTQKVTVAKTTSELKGNSKTKYTISGTGTPNKTVKQFTGTVSVNTRLNIRTGPGTNYGIVSFSPLTNGKKVDIYDAILDKNGATWYYIKLNGKYGFVSASYIKKT